MDLRQLSRMPALEGISCAGKKLVTTWSSMMTYWNLSKFNVKFQRSVEAQVVLKLNINNLNILNSILWKFLRKTFSMAYSKQNNFCHHNILSFVSRFMQNRPVEFKLYIFILSKFLTFSLCSLNFFTSFHNIENPIGTL